MDATVPSLDEFVAQATRFVAAHHPALGGGARPQEDAVRVIPERSAVAEERELARALDWRRTTYDAGFGWVDGPPEFGGRGLPPEYAAAFRAVERGFDVPDEGYTRFSVGILCPTLLEHGTPDLLAELLAPLRRADRVSCQLFSEPGAGSDLASVRTRAVRDGDQWHIDGQKVWSSGAHYSDLGLLLARTVPATRRKDGLTVFLIDMHQHGIEVRPIRQLTGGASFSEVFLTDAVVPDTRRVGDVGDGWRVINSTLMHERAIIGSDGAVDVALVGRLVELARKHGRWDDPRVRDAIVDIHVHATSSAAMTEEFFDSGLATGGPGPEMAVSKLHLTTNLQRIAEVAQEILGTAMVADSGEPDTYGWADLPLTLPGLRIGGGTDEIMRGIVAQRVLQLPR